MTVAQLINILYNIVDRMYLGRLPGHLSLTGLGLCLPIISILMGFANLCGMGGAPLCSIHRGKGENEEAERILGNSFTLLLLFGGGLTVFCLAFRRPILYLFGASDLTFPYANDYLTIYLLGTLFVIIGLDMNPFINAQGFSRMGMMTVALGAAVNIVLDPIFILPWILGLSLIHISRGGRGGDRGPDRQAPGGQARQELGRGRRHPRPAPRHGCGDQGRQGRHHLDADLSHQREETGKRSPLCFASCLHMRRRDFPCLLYTSLAGEWR